MSENGKYGYLAKNTVLFTISSFGSKILTFLLVPLYTNILTTTEYGLADLITTSVILLGYFFTLDIGNSVLRFAIEEKNKPEKILAFGIKIVTVGTILLGLIICVLWKMQLLQWPNYCYVFLWLYYIGFQFNQMLNNYLRAIDRIKAVAISGVLLTTLTIFSNIVFIVVLDLRLFGYLLSMVIGVLGTCVYQVFIIDINPIKLWKNNCSNTIKKEMIVYCIPLIFNGMAWWINSSLDKYFITFFLGASANGIYSVAYKIPTFLTMFQTIFNQAWNLSAIKEFDRDDTDCFFTNTYAIYNASLIVLCSILIFFNVFIARILFAKEFFNAWQYSSLLLISTMFSALAGFIGSIFTAIKNSKIFAVSTITAAIVNTIINYLLIPIMGIQGAAIGTVVAFFIIWLIRLICSRRYLSWNIELKKDGVAYAILVLQAILAGTQKHYYFIQLLLLFVIIILYKKSIVLVVKKMWSFVMGRKYGVTKKRV